MFIEIMSKEAVCFDDRKVRSVACVEVVLGGLELVCLALDPRFAGSKPAEDDAFLRAIKYVA
jgi:hypothetical protein